MAFTQADIDALDTAYKGGARSVTTSDGKSVTFHSVDEYIRLRALMSGEVAGSTTRSRGRRASYIQIKRDEGC